MVLTYAISARSFIDDFGAYAGFLAFVALALVALLIFSQARELRRLRDWGSQAHDRIAELERGLAAALDLARRPAPAPRAPQPGPATTGAAAAARPGAGARATAPATLVGQTAAAGATRAGAPAPARTSAPVRPTLLPAAPVGVAGPALASATVMIPLPGTPPSTHDVPEPVRDPEPEPEPRRVAAPQRTVAADASRAERVAGAAISRGRETSPAPSSDEGNGHHDEPPATLPPRPVPSRPAAGGPPRRAAAPRPRPTQPAAPLRSAGASSRAAGRGGGAPSLLDEPAPHRRRRLLAVLGVLAALVVVAGAAVMLLGGGSNKPVRTQAVQAPLDGSAAAGRQARRAQSTTAPAPPHASTTVAVLNGTPTAGLASTIAAQLTADGFQQGAVENASDANRTATVVEYRDGAKAAAEEVARALNLPPDSVMQILPQTEQVACSSTPCTATVVVTVGADKQPQQ